MKDDPGQSRADGARPPVDTGSRVTTVLAEGPGLNGLDRDASSQPGRQPGGSQHDSDSESLESTGQTIIRGRFQLESTLGSGGMGKVFKARDLRKVEASDRDPWVAIKLLNENFKDHPSSLIALQREARKSQELTHPNIVKVFDFDRDGDTVYMTMELLRGNDLAHYIDAHPHGVGVTEVRRLTRQIGEALEHAHGAGIVHADLTPKNVFLTGDGVAKVLDFGIAQAIADADVDGSGPRATAFDPASLGGVTPAYASLQRLDGEEPAPADDIYGLGCIVYELLSGAHPTQFLNARQAAAQKQKPPPIAGLKGRQWRALRKALAHRREDRYADVAGFLDDFLPERRRGRRYMAIAAAVGLLVTGAAGWQSYQARDEQRASAAELASRQAALTQSQRRLLSEREAAARQAAAALERSNGEFLASAMELIEGRQFDAAESFLSRVEDSSPEHPGLLEAQRALTSAREADEQQRREVAATEASIERLLEAANLAIAENRLVTPRGQSALSFYEEILQLDGDNSLAQRALRQLAQLQIDRIETAIAANRLQAAGAGLEDLALLSSQHPSLKRLTADLQQAQAAQQQRDEQLVNLLRRAENTASAQERRDLYLEALIIDPSNVQAKAGLEGVRAAIALSDRQARDAAQSLVEEAQALLARRPFAAVHLQQAHNLLLQAKGLSSGLTVVDELSGAMPQRYAEAIDDRLAADDYEQAEKLTQAALLLTPEDDRLIQLRDELLARLADAQRPVLPVSF